MNVREYKGIVPKIDPSAYIDPAAVIIGDVAIGAEASLWPFAVARGDVDRIVIGAQTNVQDGSVLHVTHDGPYSPGGRALLIGNGVTVGHKALLHACTVGNYCLIGMGAIIMDDVIIGEECLIAAGTLIPPGKTVAPRTLWRGNPGRYVRDLSDDDVARLHYSAEHYVRVAASYR